MDGFSSALGTRSAAHEAAALRERSQGRHGAGGMDHPEVPSLRLAEASREDPGASAAPSALPGGPAQDLPLRTLNGICAEERTVTASPSLAQAQVDAGMTVSGAGGSVQREREGLRQLLDEQQRMAESIEVLVRKSPGPVQEWPPDVGARGGRVGSLSPIDAGARSPLAAPLEDSGGGGAWRGDRERERPGGTEGPAVREDRERLERMKQERALETQRARERDERDVHREREREWRREDERAKARQQEREREEGRGWRLDDRRSPFSPGRRVDWSESERRPAALHGLSANLEAHERDRGGARGAGGREMFSPRSILSPRSVRSQESMLSPRSGISSHRSSYIQREKERYPSPSGSTSAWGDTSYSHRTTWQNESEQVLPTNAKTHSARSYLNQQPSLLVYLTN